MTWNRSRLAFLGLILGAAGCGGPAATTTDQASPERLALQEVAEVYRQYCADRQKPPQGIGDLMPLRTLGPAGVNALNTGDIVLQYGAKMTDTNDGPAATPSDQILAYGKKVPEAGGEVLLLDRTIKTLTAEEFKAAPKAAK